MYFFENHSQRALSNHSKECSQTFSKSALKHFQRALSNISKERSQTFPKSALKYFQRALLATPKERSFVINWNPAPRSLLFEISKEQEHLSAPALLFFQRAGAP